jgi:hypothetical protein
VAACVRRHIGPVAPRPATVRHSVPAVGSKGVPHRPRASSPQRTTGGVLRGPAPPSLLSFPSCAFLPFACPANSGAVSPQADVFLIKRMATATLSFRQLTMPAIGHHIVRVLLVRALIEVLRVDTVLRVAARHSRVADLHSLSRQSAVGIYPCEDMNILDASAEAHGRGSPTSLCVSPVRAQYARISSH